MSRQFIPLRAPEGKIFTVNRYGHSPKDAYFRCSSEKGRREPFHLGVNLHALTCGEEGSVTAFSSIWNV